VYYIYLKQVLEKDVLFYKKKKDMYINKNP